MKNIPLILSFAILLFTACGSTKQNGEAASENNADTITPAGAIPPADVTDSLLSATMRVKPTAKAGDSVMLTFTVYNQTGKDQTFCKWHTPFEPPMSKYLDITDEKGNEAQYLGAMAKRVMPPPASSYLTVKAGDSLKVTVNLQKSYRLDEPGTYHVKYNSEGISGLSVKEGLSFQYNK